MSKQAEINGKLIRIETAKTSKNVLVYVYKT